MSRDPDDGFRREVLPHLDLLYRFALSLTRDRADAADLVQETVLLSLQGWRRFSPGTNCRAWLLRIMRNAHAARGRVPLSRRPAREAAAALAGDASLGQELYPAPRTPEELLVERMSIRALRLAIGGLPPGYREVVVLKDLEGLAYREIAEVVGRPIGTVMSRLARGRNLLKARLARELRRPADALPPAPPAGAAAPAGAGEPPASRAAPTGRDPGLGPEGGEASSGRSRRGAGHPARGAAPDEPLSPLPERPAAPPAPGPEPARRLGVAAEGGHPDRRTPRGHEPPQAPRPESDPAAARPPLEDPLPRGGGGR